MADYYSASPAPAPPAGGWLPYPWVTQFDPGYQTTYYANAETGESSWTPPDPNVVYSQPPPSPGPIHSASRGDMYNAASTPAATSSNNAGAGGSSGGEAASFYGSAGMAPMSQQASSQQSSYSPQDQQPQQQQYDENGQPIDGERGLGKVIIGGGLAYFAYKKYKEYQKGKLNQQQFKPPYQPPNHNNETPQLHPPHGGYNYVHYPQEHFGPPKRDNLDMMNTNGPPPPMPAWDQKPSPSPYGGPPPNAYNAPVASYQQQQQPYGQPSSPYPQIPQSSYDPAPIPFNGGGAQQYGGQPPSYDAYQYGSNNNINNQGSSGFGPPTKSSWGDPRY